MRDKVAVEVLAQRAGCSCSSKPSRVAQPTLLPASPEPDQTPVDSPDRAAQRLEANGLCTRAAADFCRSSPRSVCSLRSFRCLFPPGIRTDIAANRLLLAQTPYRQPQDGDHSERKADPAKDAQGRPPRFQERRSVPFFISSPPGRQPDLLKNSRSFSSRQIILDGPVRRPALCRQLLPDDRKHFYQDCQAQGLRVPARHHRHRRTGAHSPSLLVRGLTANVCFPPMTMTYRTSFRSCRLGTPSACTAGSSSTRSRRARRSRCAPSFAKRSSITPVAKRCPWSSSATRAIWPCSGMCPPSTSLFRHRSHRPSSNLILIAWICRQVTKEEGAALAANWGLTSFVETSARTGENVNRVFDLIVAQIESELNPQPEEKQSGGCVIA